MAAVVLTMFVPVCCGAALGEDETEPVEQGKCIFSLQLQEQGAKIEFINQLRIAKEASASRFGETFSNTVKARLANGTIMEIDSFSFDCLSCHDGLVGRSRELRFRNDSQNRVSGLETVNGSHPIGMDYGSYAYAGNGFKSLDRVPAGMELIDGKVGCLSCHNPLNPKKNHLVAANSASKLCFYCHRV